MSPDSAEVDSRALRSYTVRVDTPGGRVLGTGFFVTPDLVLTCAHVVRGRPEVLIHTGDGAQGTGSVVAVSKIPTGNPGIWPYPDLALVQVPDALRRPPVLLDDRDPRNGEECHAWGFPRREDGVAPVGSPATFLFEGVEGDGHLKLKAGQAAPGLSGAPLISPARRAVVGVVAASRNVGSDLGGYAVPISALRDPLTANWQPWAPAVRTANRTANLRDRSWQRVLPVDGAEAELDRPWLDLEFVKSERSDPADLLLADFGVVPYLFRDVALAELEDWCDAPDPVSVMLVSGPGGAGKTRFAFEACRQMAGRGWLTGMWRGGDDIARIRLPRLIAVDYAESVTPIILDALLDALRLTATEFTPARLLLVTRPSERHGHDGVGLWKTGLRAARRTILDAARANEEAAARLDAGQRRRLYAESVNRFARAWDVPMPTFSGTPAVDLPLDVLFEALDHVLSGEARPTDGRDPADRVLAHEEKYWLSWPDCPSTDPALLRLSVALGTLAGAADHAEANALLGVVPVLTGDDAAGLRARLIGWLADLYRGPALINPLRPDRLGEALVARVLRDQPGDALLNAVLVLPSDEQLTRCLEVCTRLVVAGSACRNTIVRAVGGNHDALILRAERQFRGSLERPGQTTLTDALARLLSGSFAERLAEAEPGNMTYQRDLSISYERLGDLAVAGGRSGDAERLFRQSLVVAERLAEAEPGNTTYQRDLSISYERLAVAARDSGSADDALGLLTDAVRIRSALRNQEPRRLDLAEELGVTLRLYGTVVTDPAAVREAARSVLEPFEREGLISPKGRAVLSWARE